MVRTLVLGGGEDGGRWLGGMERTLGAVMLSPLVSQKLRMLLVTERGEDLQRLTELIEAGQVTPVIDSTYPLSQTPEACAIWQAATLTARWSSPSEALEPREKPAPRQPCANSTPADSRS